MEENKQALDYQTQPNYTFWDRARNDVQERLDGIFEFVGLIAAAIGGWRQIFLAVALFCILGGYGLCLEHGDPVYAHRWMAFGGFILGLIWPLKK